MLPSRVVSVPRIREAAQARADASSRRAVAREIGLTPRGLDVFLAGAKPHPRTLEKLLRWYRDQVEGAEGPPISEAEALRVLMRFFPPEARPAAVQRVTEVLRQLADETGIQFPESLANEADEI